LILGERSEGELFETTLNDRFGWQAEAPSSLKRLVRFRRDFIGQWRNLGEWHNH
jgi:hypothetical protein